MPNLKNGISHEKACHKSEACYKREVCHKTESCDNRDASHKRSSCDKKIASVFQTFYSDCDENGRETLLHLKQKERKSRR